MTGEREHHKDEAEGAAVKVFLYFMKHAKTPMLTVMSVLTRRKVLGEMKNGEGCNQKKTVRGKCNYN